MYFAQECLDMLPVPSLEVYNARGVYPLLLSVLSREQNVAECITSTPFSVSLVVVLPNPFCL